MTAITAGTVTRVTVTREDIAKGKRENCVACPVARAIMRITGCLASGYRPIVEVDIVCIEADDNPVRARLPKTAQDFISRFDRWLNVAPFEFEIEWEDA